MTDKKFERYERFDDIVQKLFVKINSGMKNKHVEIYVNFVSSCD